MAVVEIQWNPDFTNLQGKRKLVRKMGEFEKLEVKLQYLTEEGKRLLVRVVRRFEKLRVREIGNPLYKTIKPKKLELCRVSVCVYCEFSDHPFKGLNWSGLFSCY